ncbi:alcohol dehydrogenase catalytic domain-containing protein [Nonomuraea sp. NPDC050540]|uniref:alcohol dehydrogenase catalytic domain-containing protein n=1 Tax=Nonomuraea sp. NPDC050540 TaxID=3364367 RepID=UPI003795948C
MAGAAPTPAVRDGASVGCPSNILAFLGTPPLPMTLGWELAGIVVNPGTSGFSVGERVFGMSHQLATGRGSWADLVAIPASSITQATTRRGARFHGMT